MSYCPNPDCPFRKRFGESAEFSAGTVACSDCGTALIADDTLGKVVKEKAKFKMHDIYKRLIWTLALLGFWSILRHFPLPGTNSESLELLAAKGGARITLFALGLIPYITASVLVEIIALFVQPLKQWRLQGGYSGRARLSRTARYLTLVIAIFHGRALVWQMGQMAGGRLLVNDGTAFKSLIVLTLVAAAFLLLWIADQISARGCGHGVSLIILSGFAGKTTYGFAQALPLYGKALSSPQFIVPVLAIAGAIVLILLMERSARKFPVQFADGTEAWFPIKLTTAGTTPVWWAHTLLIAPLFLVPMNEAFDQASRPLSTWFVQNVHQGTVFYAATSAILVVIFYYLMTALFFNHREMIGYLRERNVLLIPNEAEGKKNIDRGLESMALIGSLYLVLVPLSLQGVWLLLHTEVRPVDGIALIVAACIALDLTNELLFRWRAGKVVGIAEFHEPWKTGLFRSLLEKENVPSLTRGYYHRSLLYLFGPYIEMTVYVAADKEDVAQEVRRRYMNTGNEII